MSNKVNNQESRYMQILRNMARFFALFSNIIIMMLNVLYLSVIIHSVLWIALAGCMAVGSIIITAMTIYNTTTIKEKGLTTSLSIKEACIQNTKTKCFVMVIMPSLLLHTVSTGISTYTSTVLLGAALGANTLFFIIAIVISTVAVLACSTYNFVQGHDVLLRLANSESLYPLGMTDTELHTPCFEEKPKRADAEVQCQLCSVNTENHSFRSLLSSSNRPDSPINIISNVISTQDNGLAVTPHEFPHFCSLNMAPTNMGI